MEPPTCLLILELKLEKVSGLAKVQLALGLDSSDGKSSERAMGTGANANGSPGGGGGAPPPGWPTVCGVTAANAAPAGAGTPTTLAGVPPEVPAEATLRVERAMSTRKKERKRRKEQQETRRDLAELKS